jgi:hypothetical protein
LFCLTITLPAGRLSDEKHSDHTSDWEREARRPCDRCRALSFSTAACSTACLLCCVHAREPLPVSWSAARSTSAKHFPNSRGALTWSRHHREVTYRISGDDGSTTKCRTSIWRSVTRFFVESESLLKSWPRGGRTLYTLSRSFVSVLRSHFFGTLKHARDPWPGPPTNPLERPVDRPSKQAWQSPEPQPRR